MSEQRPPAILVATLNLRNNSDRWDERAPLLVAQFVALRPDVIGLQEVRRPIDQAEWIAERVNAQLAGEPPYQVFQTNKTGLAGLVEGIAVLSRLPLLEREWLDLGGGSRVAQRARIRLPDGRVLDFYNTHLHHPAEDEPLRTEQARRLLAWLAERPDVPQVLVGDFNAGPDAPSVRLIRERLRSAYAAVHGREPPATFPTPLSREWGEFSVVIDYIFVNDLVTVH
ncbi:MAG TPA: endonuclease/exonuclease/phosphatase family protein, partial [Dehalococcoidia bacterium]